MILRELDSRIREGQAAIAKAKVTGRDVKDWEEYLRRLKAARNRISLELSIRHSSHIYIGSDDVTNAKAPLDHPHEGHTGGDYLPLTEVFRLLSELFCYVNSIYLPDTVGWLKAEKPELWQEVLSLERILRDQGKALAQGRGNRAQFDYALSRHRQLWEKAIALRKVK
jgi:hypothetical protein